MTSITIDNTMPRTYKNNGQHAEQVFIYTLTGQIVKASNLPASAGGDFQDIQIKSQKATVCRGTDIIEHLKHDGAKRYAYVNKDFTIAYIMEKTEYIKFVENFAIVTRESDKNGGHTKLRLKAESEKMREWLSENA